MPRFKLTPRAREDLKRIGRYTLATWGRQQRDAYLRRLDRRLAWLADNPRLGRHRPDLQEGYYCFPEGAHLIFYLQNEDGIVIIGLPHQEMDIPGYFGD